MKNLNKFWNKNIYIILLLLLLIFSYYFYKYNKNIEPYLLNCNINNTLDAVNSTTFKSYTFANNPYYGCSDLSYIYFYKTKELDNLSNIVDISTTTWTTDEECNIHSYDYDFYTFNSNSTDILSGASTTNDSCIYYNFKQLSDSAYSNANNNIFIDCSSNKLSSTAPYSFIGKGGITRKGHNNLKDTYNFKNVAHVNNICMYDLCNNKILQNLKECISNDGNLNTCFGTFGKQFIQNISSDYINIWDKTSDFVDGSGVDYIANYDGSDYINTFYEAITKDAVLDTCSNYIDISLNNEYNTNLENSTITNLEYNSTFLKMVFLLIVFTISIILGILSITNPSIVSVEILISYVIFIALIIFIGSKFFNQITENIATWKTSLIYGSAN